MKDLRNKVAVITGAASGIGRSLVEKAAEEGMKIVLAGINEANLLQVERELKARGATVISVQTDVSKENDVVSLAQKTLSAFGAVHLLCNNAGAVGGGSIWESSLDDWRWLMGVNLWGVIFGVRVFVPIMLSQNTDCHILNTASTAGLLSPPGMGIYNVTKHGVVALSETLYQELAARSTLLKVSVLCPSYVRTKILDSSRNHPSHQNRGSHTRMTEAQLEAGWQSIASTNYTVISSQQVADCAFKAILKDQFYILTHPESKEWVQSHADDVINERNPALTQ
jgi:NAD(P)-dependent dehydrogenase (short-subunit alcohol dehydrogenase family)